MGGTLKITFDTEKGNIESNGKSFPFLSHEGFKIASELWLRVGWDNKYVYTFQWFGRPIIQLPDDMIRAQEVIYRVKPTVIIETGVAHGGSLIYYASLLKLIGGHKVIGVDIEIRPHNRLEIEKHFMSPMIDLIEGDAKSPEVLKKVGMNLKPSDRVLVFLDSNHTKDHVLSELEHYSQFVTPGSYIVATDGIMEYVVGAPRSQADWETNNPKKAAEEFTAKNSNFVIEHIKPEFDESKTTDAWPTYWPSAYIKRIN